MPAPFAKGQWKLDTSLNPHVQVSEGMAVTEILGYVVEMR